MVEAIFWDNDGILMETEHLYYRANAEILAGEGVELTMGTFREISLRRGESVLKLTPADGEELRRRRDIRYRELLRSEAAVIPGVRETLERLHGTVPMAVVTSCRRENFVEQHRTSDILHFFDFILTREDYVNSKPDPEPYLTACARAGFPPASCVAVEDSERGVVAAHRAGLRVAAVPGSLNEGGDFRSARWRLESVAELPDLLGFPLP